MQVEKILMKYAFAHPHPSDNLMRQFYELYGADENSTPYIKMLYQFKEKKERFYLDKLPNFNIIFDYGYLTALENKQICGFGAINIPKNQMDHILGKNVKGGYIQKIKDFLITFRNERLKGNQVSYVYLTAKFFN